MHLGRIEFVASACGVAPQRGAAPMALPAKKYGGSLLPRKRGDGLPAPLRVLVAVTYNLDLY